MGISFGGLGVVLSHKRDWSFNYMLPRQVEIRSMFFATVFLLVLLFLAYLTNPSESSFRSFLTEQSFRQHLSRLDDVNDDDRADSEDSGVHYTLSRRKPPQRVQGLGIETSPVVFSSGAKVSLRTPKHVFRNFGILTIAAVIPVGKRDPKHHGEDRDHKGETSDDGFGFGFGIWDSWFIGAFGKWWRGGAIESWWYDSLVSTKDEEAFRSGLFDIKASDSYSSDKYNGLPIATAPPPQRSPPRLRQRERSAHLAPRSSTPPPLPKSASLPLHATRLIPPAPPDYRQVNGIGNGDRSSPQSQCLSASYTTNPLSSSSSDLGQVSHSGRVVLSRTPSSSTIFDQSPVIADILRQIASSRIAVDEAHTQLSDFQQAASQSHAALQTDLDAHRERKKAEDANRVELKTRTRQMEEAKRSADGGKRDAEKRLRLAQTSRDNALQRIAHLDKEIASLHDRMVNDEEAMECSKEEMGRMEKEMGEALEEKRKEIKIAEDIIAALNGRTKELEELIGEEKMNLQRARDQAEIRKQDRTFIPLHVVNTEPEPAPWPPICCGPQDAAATATTQLDLSNPDLSSDIGFQISASASQAYHSKESSELSQMSSSKSDIPIRPRKLSLAGISNLNPSTDALNRLALRAKGYSIFGEDIKSLTESLHQHYTNFAPFDADLPDSGIGTRTNANGDALQPTATATISKTLTLTPNSLPVHPSSGETGDNANAVTSDYDALVAREWLSSQRSPYPQQLDSVNASALTTSPTSLTGKTHFEEYDPFEVRLPPRRERDRGRFIADSTSHQNVAFPTRGHSDPSVEGGQSEGEAAIDHDGQRPGPRRWFSTSSKDKPKKGLNPDAKVFSLAQRRSLRGTGVESKSPTSPSSSMSMDFDPLTPSGRASCGTGMPSTPVSSNSFFSSVSMRAFAPSPQEREVLQRALGSSANTSLERLPSLSLSEVGNLPTSPSHVHAAASQFHQKAPSMGDLSTSMPRRSWFQALPRVHKLKFSPWEDEEPLEKAGSDNKDEGNAL